MGSPQSEVVNEDGLDNSLPFVKLGDVQVRRDFSTQTKTPLGLTIESTELGVHYRAVLSEAQTQELLNLLKGASNV